MGLKSLKRPPEARAEPVEDLVIAAIHGGVRLPPFQRKLKWTSYQVVELFDSVHRGLPIGALLLQKRPAEAGRVTLGPLEFDAPAVAEALWVVDGQQRLTSLAAGLGRPVPLPRTPVDAFVVYFDSSSEQFRAPPKSGDIPDTWIPVPLLLDAAQLGEWVLEWPHRSNKEFTKRAFEAGKRIREYRVPLYVISTDDVEVLRDIFFRVNNSGKSLKWNEVFDALYGHEGSVPSTTTQLARELAPFGMGKIEPGELTACLLALRGLDVTRTLAEHRRKDPDVLRGAVADALPVLKQVLSFLRARAGIPHLRLLPRTLPIEVLTRFFALHTEPNARSLELLTRWVWRSLLGNENYDERTLRRRAIAAVNQDEEESIQALLELVPRGAQIITVPTSFDARSADSRRALLALASLRPQNLLSDEQLDVAALIEAADVDAFRTVVYPRRAEKIPLVQGPANRVIHPKIPELRRVIAKRLDGNGEAILATHAITLPAAKALAAGHFAEFLMLREAAMRKTIEQLGATRAGWGRGDRDRPSLSYLLRRAGDGA